jgi:hypothetical protein
MRGDCMLSPQPEDVQEEYGYIEGISVQELSPKIRNRVCLLLKTFTGSNVRAESLSHPYKRHELYINNELIYALPKFQSSKIGL